MTPFKLLLALPKAMVIAWTNSGGLKGLVRLVWRTIRHEGLGVTFMRIWFYLCRTETAPEHEAENRCNSWDFSSNPPEAWLIAFYLPQFHPFTENDEWWGKGFTKRQNVTQAEPQYVGHDHPHVPADLGFYDPRTSEIMHAQASMAQHYGIHGFCFYFYWLGGKVLMEASLRRWLEDSSIEMPFCLCWDNESWTRSWDGQEQDVLIAQQYSAPDDLAFIEHISPYLLDPRYIRVENKPVLLVYQTSVLPDARQTARRWREWWHEKHGGELFLLCVHSKDRPNPLEIGFDACVEFPLVGAQVAKWRKLVELINPTLSGRIYDYKNLLKNGQKLVPSLYPEYRSVMPGSDNTARRKNSGFIFQNSSPKLYRRWLHEAITYSRWFASRKGPPIVFINAWNEWAKDAHLEPDLRYGHAYLQATAQALASWQDDRIEILKTAPRKHSIAVILHLFYPELAEEFKQQMAPIEADIWITIVDRSIQPLVERLFPHAHIVLVPNRGRDIAPFLSVARIMGIEQYEFALKLHSKRSPHIQDGDHWRRKILSGLLPENFNLALFLSCLRSNPDIGVIAPPNHKYKYYISENIGSNQHMLTRLETLAGVARKPKDEFVSGSMFWFRPQAFLPLLELPIRTGDFEFEEGQIDGTLAHALERFIGIAVRSSGYRIAEFGEIS